MNINKEKNYKEYQQLYEEYLRVNDIFLSKYDQFDDPPIIEDTKEIKVKFKQTNFTIIKPIYTSLSTELSKSMTKCYDLMTKYDFEKKQIIYNGSNNLNKIKELTLQIVDVNEHINSLRRTMKELLDDCTTKNNKAKNHNEEIIRQKGSLYDKAINANDDVQKQQTINEYLSVPSDMVSMSNCYDEIDIFMESPPILETNNMDKSERKLTKKLKAIKSKINKSETELKQELKETIKKSIFNTLEECNSTKRSKPYYLTKKELYDIIEKDPLLKKKVGKMYKKLSRQDLCDKLFM